MCQRGTISANLTSLLLNAMMAVFIIITCVCSARFFIRRHTFLLSARQSILTLSYSTTIVIYCILYTFQTYFSFQMPCWTTILTSLSSLAFTVIITVRTFVLAYNHELSEKRALPQAQLNSWVIRNRFLVQKPFIYS